MCIVLQYSHLKQQSYRVAANNVKLSVFKKQYYFILRSVTGLVFGQW